LLSLGHYFLGKLKKFLYLLVTKKSASYKCSSDWYCLSNSRVSSPVHTFTVFYLYYMTPHAVSSPSPLFFLFPFLSFLSFFSLFFSLSSSLLFFSPFFSFFSFSFFSHCSTQTEFQLRLLVDHFLRFLSDTLLLSLLFLSFLLHFSFLFSLSSTHFFTNQ